MHLSINRVTNKRMRGDTMVEVLIAIAVVSLILGGAYVTTNKSLQATRSAQERAIALKLAEAQIEQLKGIVGDPSRSALVFGATAPDPFCISPSTNAPISTSGTNCHFNTSGAANNTAEPVFRISIDRTGNDFVLTERWYNVSGQVTDGLDLRYRLYD